MGLPTSKRHDRNRSGKGSEIETIRASEREKELLTDDMAEGFVTGLAKMRNVMLIFLRCSHHFRLRGSRKASHSSGFFPTLSPSLLLPFFHRHPPNTLAQNSVAGSLLPHKIWILQNSGSSTGRSLLFLFAREALCSDKPPKRNKARPTLPNLNT